MTANEIRDLANQIERSLRASTYHDNRVVLINDEPTQVVECLRELSLIRDRMPGGGPFKP
jgi:hypothetical protein